MFIVKEGYIERPKMTGQEERFNTLIDNYAIAIQLTDNIIDSGLLEQKVKIKDHSLFRKSLALRTAASLREAEQHKSSIILDKYEMSLICDIYFEELKARGDEWRNADLAELFIKEKKLCQSRIEQA